MCHMVMMEFQPGLIEEPKTPTRLAGDFDHKKPKGEWRPEALEHNQAVFNVRAMFADAGLDIADLQFTAASSDQSFAERCVHLEQYTRVFAYERQANTYADMVAAETNSVGTVINWQRVKQGMIVSDIGKSGPRNANTDVQAAIMNLFSIERVEWSEQGNPLSDFIKYHFPADIQAKIGTALGAIGIDPDTMTLSQLWDKHIEWTEEILRASNFPQESTEAALFHHIFRGLYPGYKKIDAYTFQDASGREVHFDAEKKWVVLLDMYEGLRNRSGQSHEKAIAAIQSHIATTAYAADPELSNFVQLLDQALSKKSR